MFASTACVTPVPVMTAPNLIPLGEFVPAPSVMTCVPLVNDPSLVNVLFVVIFPFTRISS